MTRPVARCVARVPHLDDTAVQSLPGTRMSLQDCFFGVLTSTTREAGSRRQLAEAAAEEVALDGALGQQERLP